VAKKPDVRDEIEEYRKENIKYEVFHGKLDSTYMAEFSKPLIELGFSLDQIVTLLVNKLAIDLSIELKQVDIEIEKYKLDGGVCNCPECKKAREEGEDEGL
jgi:hypothetical protein